MNKPIWAFDRAVRDPFRVTRALRRAEAGNATIGFGLILPLLISLCMGIVEFSLVVFDFHRVSEATRAGARMAAFGTPLASVGNMVSGDSVTCTGTGGSLSCTGGGSGPDAALDTLMDRMRALFPTLSPANVRVTYSDSGLGDPDTPGGVLPLVRLDLIGVEHHYIVLDVIPGIGESFVYPPFTTTLLGPGRPGS